MPLSGFRVLGEDGYLPPDERERRAREKEIQLEKRGLTPDWFTEQGNLCLPSGGLNVAVIGGGFAGLAAAWYLRSCKASVVVYEAGAQVGGRVRTDRSFAEPKVVEAGAELIGENHPLWRILARRLNLGLVPLSDEASFPHDWKKQLVLGGRELSEAEQEQLQRDLAAPLATIGSEALAIGEVEPWQAGEAARLDAISIEARLSRLPGITARSVREWFKFTLGNDNCAPVSRQSYLGLLASVSAARLGSDPAGMLGYWMSTETHRCERGNDRLSGQLGQQLGHDLRISTSVDAITVQPPSYFPPLLVDSSQRDPSGAVVARRREGFHYAVLAVPPTVWGAISFTPKFAAAERSLQHGPAIKFLTRYPTDFWAKAKLAPLARSDRLGSVWEGTDNQPGPPWFGLSVFSGGQFVLPAKSYPAELSRLYPTRTSAPGSERFIDWPSEPHILTGYAVPGLGQVSTIMPAQLRPHQDRLYFAGEQTSPGFFGYMEGALQSGARAARDIVKAVAVPCPRTMTADAPPGRGADDRQPAPGGDGAYHGGGGQSGGGGSSDSY